MSKSNKKAATAHDAVRWEDSLAREILASDLETGVLPLYSDDLSPKEAWEVYGSMPEFSGMLYEKFRTRLNDLRKSHRSRQIMADRDAKALHHDRKLHPRSNTNSRGEPIFDLSPAKPLLAKDVSNRKHLALSLRRFHQSRPEFLIFSRDVFKGRVYQEVRRQKFIAYLEKKRKEDKKKKMVKQAKGAPVAAAGHPKTQEDRQAIISSRLKEKKVPKKHKSEASDKTAKRHRGN